MCRCPILACVLVILMTAPAMATVYETNPRYPDILMTLTIGSLTFVQEEVLDSTNAEGWLEDLGGADRDQWLGGSDITFPEDEQSLDQNAAGLVSPSGFLADSGRLDSWFTISFMANAGGGSCVFYPNPLTFPMAGRSRGAVSPPSLTSFDRATILFHFHISYYLAMPGQVTLTVYNMERERQRTLVSEPQNMGWHHMIWDGTDDMGRKAAPGLYVCHLVNHRTLGL
ncbi:MAG: hypothetical protein KAW17_01895 [Candidatus Eisenbacteria sp.]|nr:hypothetical protein [Candidatus Eisenbacteria bacterium]